MQRVLADSNVLASRTLTDWLFHLRRCNEAMFSVYWTRDIQVEAARVMRKRNPQWSGLAIDRRLCMLEDVVDEMITYPEGDYAFTGQDEHDFHVHAAAVYGRANYLLTSNQEKDFTTHPAEEEYEVITPDSFFLLVAKSNPTGFHEAVKGQYEYYSKPGRCPSLTEPLQKAGCKEFAVAVKGVLQHVAQHD